MIWSEERRMFVSRGRRELLGFPDEELDGEEEDDEEDDDRADDAGALFSWNRPWSGISQRAPSVRRGSRRRSPAVIRMFLTTAPDRPKLLPGFPLRTKSRPPALPRWRRSSFSARISARAAGELDAVEGELAVRVDLDPGFRGEGDLNPEPLFLFGSDRGGRARASPSGDRLGTGASGPARKRAGFPRRGRFVPTGSDNMSRRWPTARTTAAAPARESFVFFEIRAAGVRIPAGGTSRRSRDPGPAGSSRAMWSSSSPTARA